MLHIILKTKHPFVDLESDYFTTRNKSAAIRRTVRQPERLGYKVNLCRIRQDAGAQTTPVLCHIAYDSDELRKALAEHDISVYIPSRANRREPIAYDAELYQRRNTIECTFGSLKESLLYILQSL